MLDATQIPKSLQALSPKAAHFCLGVERFLLQELWPTKKDWREDVRENGRNDGNGENGCEGRNDGNGENGSDGRNERAGGKGASEEKACKGKPLAGKTFVVALSGGADSVALLLVLFYLQKRLGIRVEAVHVHHGLRAEADDEAKAVAHFCEDLGVECTVHRASVLDEAERLKIGTEEAGRLARYALFGALVQANDTWVALGHHGDDLCEDVLMRLIRGAGWPALGGMAGLDDARKIMRPLLGTSRAEIENFLKDLGVDWVNDASNASLEYRRNRIRHNVMPFLREENPAIHETLLSLWKLARIDADFWQERLCKMQDAIGEEHRLERNVLRTLSQAERLRLYKMMLDDLGDGQASVTTLLALDDAWQCQRGGLSFQFTGNKIASIHRGAITFSVLCTDA